MSGTDCRLRERLKIEIEPAFKNEARAIIEIRAMLLKANPKVLGNEVRIACFISGKLIEEGQAYYDGKIHVNPCGGLKACGHPVGATGVKQIMEIVHQLRGDAGKRQVDGATVGLSHNVGGTGATVVVNVFSR